MVLPEGFVVPPGPYLVGLVVIAALVGAAIGYVSPRVTQSTVVAFVPWMAVGGALHVVAVQGVVGEPMRHLLEAPAVYLTTAVLAGIVWLLAVREPLDLGSPHESAVVLGGVGVLALVIPVVAIVAAAAARGTLAPTWPAVGLVLAVALTAIVWWAMARAVPTAVHDTGWAGLVVVFAHVLDGVSTTIGVDVLGGGERSPIPRRQYSRYHPR